MTYKTEQKQILCENTLRREERGDAK
jgi:hypothetical protein